MAVPVSLLTRLLLMFYISLYFSIFSVLPILAFYLFLELHVQPEKVLDEQMLSGSKEISTNTEISYEVLETTVENTLSVFSENSTPIVCSDLGVLLFVGSCVLIPSLCIFAAVFLYDPARHGPFDTLSSIPSTDASISSSPSFPCPSLPLSEVNKLDSVSCS